MTDELLFNPKEYSLTKTSQMLNESFETLPRLDVKKPVTTLSKSTFEEEFKTVKDFCTGAFTINSERFLSVCDEHPDKPWPYTLLMEVIEWGSRLKCVEFIVQLIPGEKVCQVGNIQVTPKYRSKGLGKFVTRQWFRTLPDDTLLRTSIWEATALEKFIDIASDLEDKGLIEPYTDIMLETKKDGKKIDQDIMTQKDKTFLDNQLLKAFRESPIDRLIENLGYRVTSFKPRFANLTYVFHLEARRK